MIEIEWKCKGVFALANLPPGETGAVIGRVTGLAVQQALGDYAQGRTEPSLSSRFSGDAFAVYGFSARSPKYQRRQLKVLGVLRPYYSPRALDFALLAKNILKRRPMGIVNAAQDLIFNQAHMIDLVRVPGTGFGVRMVQTSRDVTVSLTLPGARILNRGGGRAAIYRQQLLDLKRGGGRDIRGIMERAQEYYDERLPAAVHALPSTSLRGAA